MHEDAFVIGQSVRIDAHGIGGKVRAFYTDAGGTQYSVEYVDSTGRITDRYFRGNEISAA
jgi:hypothetical protein